MADGRKDIFSIKNCMLVALAGVALSACTNPQNGREEAGGVTYEANGATGKAISVDKSRAHGARISFTEAIKKALAVDPEIGVAQAQLDGAKAQVDIEEANTRPVVDLVATTGKENTYPEGPNTYGANRSELTLSIEQTLYDFGATKAGVDRRAAQASSVELRKRDTMESIALETVFAYIDYLRQSELVSASRRNTRNHQRIADLVILNEQGGNATKADVNRANTRVEAAKSSLLDAQNAREDAIVGFRRLTGLRPESVKVPKRLAPVRQTKSRSASKAAILLNPELQSLERDRVAFERQLAQQRAAIKPRVFLRGEGNYNENVGGETGTNSDVRGVIGVNVRLYSGGARRAQLRQTEARIREARESYRAKLRDLEQNTEEVNQTLETAAENSAFVNERFRTANDGLQLFQQQFEAGERTAFELLDAQRDLFQAETELINNRYQFASSIYEELRLRGNLVATLLSGL